MPLTLDDFDGYSVAKRNGQYLVIRNELEVARITPCVLGKLGFSWHIRDMWKFVSTDFVKGAQQ